MGPTLKKQTITLLGAKGGVGATSICAIAAQLFSRSQNKRVAIVDGTPYSRSILYSYLTVPGPSRSLSQLIPYLDHLNQNLIEKYFSSSSNLTYVPISLETSETLTSDELTQMVKKMSTFFDYTFFDLSSIPIQFHEKLIENSEVNFVLTALDHSGHLAIKNVEKRINEDHFDIKRFKLILNQTQASQKIPKDAPLLSQSIKLSGTIPFLGEDLLVNLIEKKSFIGDYQKKFSIIEQLISQTENPEIQKPADLNLQISATNKTGNLQLAHELHQKLLEKMRQTGILLENVKSTTFNREVLEPQAREILDSLIQDLNLGDRTLSQNLVIEVINLAFGLGPLERLLSDSEITEVMVNGPHQIFIEKKGILQKSDVEFLNELQLRTAIERILAPIGRRLDESQPYVDGRLQDGSRVNAVIPPISLNGPLLTIRKFSKNKLTVSDLIRFGSVTQDAADFLGACVKARKNIVVSGGTGSGKTTLLNILSNFIPAEERIVTIEDSAELQLNQEHVVRLESRPANIEGTGRISIRDLVINSLRMRPDRIVVGECRGGEALDMLQAMNTGHDGSMTTAHANTSRDALARLETMCLFAGIDLPLKAIREQISRAVDLIVQQTRLPNGKRTITQISEVQGMEGDVIILQDIFVYEKEKGLIRQPFSPSFIKSLNAIGYQWVETN